MAHLAHGVRLALQDLPHRVALHPPSGCLCGPEEDAHGGFWGLKEGQAVEFTFKKPSKGLESIRVLGPGGVLCIGSERWPKGQNKQKRRSKGERCYNSAGLDHHAKEGKLPPRPKKCPFCQSIHHMVASCPRKAQRAPSSHGKPTYLGEEEGESHSPALLPEPRCAGLSFCDQNVLRSRHQWAEWRKWGQGGQGAAGTAI